jgi:2,5-diamino-6-(ribosylamino)-4(3H)-pyrimidinone 5'-phosphate reductase
MPQPFPHVHVNAAMSVDGKIDTISRLGAAISSDEDRARVDRLRAAVDAVLVGGHTLLVEDPSLTVKSARLRAARTRKGRPANPAKVGVVSEIGPQDLPTDGRFLSSGPARVFIFTTQRTVPAVVSRLQAAAATLHVTGERRVDLRSALATLGAAGIQSILVEGGGTLISEFFRLGLVDEATIYIAPRIFGGVSAPTLADGPGFNAADAPQLRLKSVRRLDQGGGILAHYFIAPKE